ARLLATADKVGHVVVWDVSTGKQLAAIETPLMYTWDPRQRRHSIGGVRSLAFSPDAKLLAIGGTGQINNIDHLEALARIEVFDWQENRRTLEHPGDKHKGLVERLEFAPDGSWLVSAGGDNEGFVKFLSPADGKVLHQRRMGRDSIAQGVQPWVCFGECGQPQRGRDSYPRGYRATISCKRSPACRIQHQEPRPLSASQRGA